MRDPTLIEQRSANDLRVKPPHGRQTRVALGLDTNGGDRQTNGYVHQSTSRENADFQLVYRRDVYGDRQNGVSQDAGETAQALHISAAGRPQALQRARSDFGPRHRGEMNAAVVEEDLWRMRHGWEDEYTSNEYLALLNSVRSHMFPSNGFY